MLWCDVYDNYGHSLSVNFGPCRVCICNYGQILIRYDSIKSYYARKECCDGLCGYGVGRVDQCTGTRQHSCSCCCEHKQIVIQFKESKHRSMCGVSYDSIAISVNNDDYQAFKKLMDEKLGIVTKEDEEPITTI